MRRKQAKELENVFSISIELYVPPLIKAQAYFLCDAKWAQTGNSP